MFCEKCGVPTEGDQTLCSKCAAEETAVLCEEETVPAEQYVPVAEATETAEPDTFVLNTAETASEEKAPKKKRGLVAGIAALVVVAAAAIGIIFSWNSISGFIGRTFQSPEDYLADVESAAIAEYSADLTQAYGKMLANYSKNLNSSQAEIRLTLGDELLSLAETALQQQGMNMDLDWIREITMSLNTNLQDDAMQMGVGIGLGQNNLLSADIICDLENGKGYVALPELNKNYLSADFSYDNSFKDVQDILSKSMELNSDLVKDLPTEEELNKMINSYVDVILSEIDDVEKETDTISIDDASQKMVVLSAKISQKDMLDIAEKVLKKAEKDKTLKKFIKAFSDYANAVNSINGYSYDTVDLYKEFTDAIPYALEDLEDMSENADSGNYVLLDVYVDMQNNVRGHELSVYTDGEKSSETISWLTVAKGDVIYTEADLIQVQISGEKTEKKGVSEGSYTLHADGSKIGTLEFENLTEAGGTLRLIPSEEIVGPALSGSSIPAALLGDNMALELVYTENSCQVNILVGSKTLVGLGLTAEASDGGKISIPTGAASADNQADIMQWVQGLDFDAVLKALESANVPSELVGYLRSYVGMLQY